MLTSSRLGGRRVIAEGYLDYADTRRETLPLRWVWEGEVELRFRQGRHSRVEVARPYRVP